MSREEIEQKMDELARKYVETHEPEIREEIYRLGRELEKMGEGVTGWPFFLFSKTKLKSGPASLAVMLKRKVLLLSTSWASLHLPN
jgi:hypothetical protein